MLVQLEQSICNTGLETAQRVPRYILGQISACCYKLLCRVLNSCRGMQRLSSSRVLVRVQHKGARELKMSKGRIPRMGDFY